MKVNRRGLGGLFAGAVTALHVPKSGKMQVNKVTMPDTVAMSMPGEVAKLQTPEEELKYLLEQRAQAPTYEQRSRHSASEIFDLDVKALKSCSPAGRDMIQRQRLAAYSHESHKRWIEGRLEELLKRHPFLRILT